MLLPVIAIVGRPNVGKSAFFNRWTSTRDAIVSDTAGMTRDRQYGEVVINDQRIIVVDTGGITDEKNELQLLMSQQSFQAIAEADQILFLVEVRAGLTADDLVIAKKLRTLQKDIFVIVNKAEGMDPDLAVAEFFRLGFGTPIPISAAHGRGISELSNIVLNKYIEKPVEAAEDPLAQPGVKLAIIGRPNVGKSTLTNRMLGEERVIVLDQPGTTRDSIAIPLKRFDKDYILIDTAGIRRRGKIFEATEKFSVVKTLQAIAATNVVLFVIDGRDGVTEQDLRLLGFILENGKSLVIAINKWDGMSEDDRIKTQTSIDRSLHFVSFVKIHFISALHGSGVGNLFGSIDEAYLSASKKLPTPLLTKILQTAVTEHQPPLVQGRRIKLRYAHAGGHNPPRIIIHGNQVDALPESYRRYLANTFQEKLRMVGTPVVIQLKSSENPFKDVKNKLTDRQVQKKKRLIRHVKR
jgi:GTP-binding protein